MSGPELNEEKLRRWHAELLSELSSRLTRSGQLYEKACRVLPAGVNHPIRLLEPFPFYVAHAKGVKVWDIDGNIYDDYWMGHGALILGHSPKPVVEAVRQQVELGSHFGYAHELETELAELVVKHVPNVDMVRFTNSGTEAVMYAVRLARAYTGKKKIVKFEGGWHGGYDALHTAVHPPFKGPESGGLPREYLAYTVSLPFNETAPVEKTLSAGDVAAVIVEPVMGAGGAIPAEKGFLDGLRELCDRYGALLVFDEVITGFRLALGGGQQYFGVNADVVVMGKIMGGGYPIGAFGAREDVMRLLDPRLFSGPKGSYHGGTFTGNPVSMTGGIATIRELEKPGVYEKLNQLGDHLTRSLEKVVKQQSYGVHVTGAGSIVGVHFTRCRPGNGRESWEKRWSRLAYRLFHAYALRNGIAYMTREQIHFLLSASHERKEINRLVETFAAFLDELHTRGG